MRIQRLAALVKAFLWALGTLCILAFTIGFFGAFLELKSYDKFGALTQAEVLSTRGPFSANRSFQSYVELTYKYRVAEEQFQGVDDWYFSRTDKDFPRSGGLIEIRYKPKSNAQKAGYVSHISDERGQSSKIGDWGLAVLGGVLSIFTLVSGATTLSYVKDAGTKT